MIYNDDLIFIHIGKTGGMSCSDYLLHVLKPTIHMCHAEARTTIRDPKGVVPHTEVDRHCTLAEALAFIKEQDGRDLEDFAKALAVIRHPFTLEYSYYQHLQKPHIRKRRRKVPELLDLAMGPFADFVAGAGYHRPKHTQDAFFLLDGEIPDRVELLRFEDLPENVIDAVAPYARPGAKYSFPHRNRSENAQDLRDALTDEVREAIYHKHRYMFDSGLYSVDDL